MRGDQLPMVDESSYGSSAVLADVKTFFDAPEALVTDED